MAWLKIGQLILKTASSYTAIVVVCSLFSQLPLSIEMLIITDQTKSKDLGAARCEFELRSLYVSLNQKRLGYTDLFALALSRSHGDSDTVIVENTQVRKMEDICVCMRASVHLSLHLCMGD